MLKMKDPCCFRNAGFPLYPYRCLCHAYSFCPLFSGRRAYRFLGRMKICTLHTSYYFFESFPVNSKIVFDNLIVSYILADPGAKSDVNIVPYPDLVFKNNVRADPCIIPNICLFADSYTGTDQAAFSNGGPLANGIEVINFCLFTQFS